MKKIILFMMLCVGFMPTLRGDEIFTNAEISELMKIIRTEYPEAIRAEVLNENYQPNSFEREFAIQRFQDVTGGKIFGAITKIFEEPNAFVIGDAKIANYGMFENVYSVHTDNSLMKALTRSIIWKSDDERMYHFTSDTNLKTMLLCIPDTDQLKSVEKSQELEAQVLPNATAFLELRLTTFFEKKFKRTPEGDIVSVAGILNFCFKKELISPTALAKKYPDWSVISLPEIGPDQRPLVMSLMSDPEPMDPRFMPEGHVPEPIETGKMLVDSSGFAFSQSRHDGKFVMILFPPTAMPSYGFVAREDPWIVIPWLEE